jgi:small conductance mechanosensitive channel
MTQLVVNVTPPWGGEELDVGPYIGSLVTVVCIIIAAAIILRLARVFVRGILRTLLSRENQYGAARDLTSVEIKRRQDTIETLVVNVVRFFVIAIALLMILETAFKLDIGPAIAGLGIVGIAVGLGTQNLVRDYLNGALITIENQYSIGDIVTVAGISGSVEDFTLRRTTLRDSDGTLHTVPNGQITTSSNMTRNWARVNIELRVAYGSEVEPAVEVINRLGREMADDPAWAPRLLEPPHVERVDDFGDTGVTLLVRGRVRAAEQWAVAGELRKRLLGAFGENALRMPRAFLPGSPIEPAEDVPPQPKPGARKA